MQFTKEVEDMICEKKSRTSPDIRTVSAGVLRSKAHAS